MKDDTLILLAALGIGGYFVYKTINDTKTVAESAVQGALDLPGNVVRDIVENVTHTEEYVYKTVDDTLKGASKGVQDTINFVGNLPQALTPPMPVYIQNEVTQARKNAGLVTNYNPAPVAASKDFPFMDNILATQKGGYITANFDQPLQISTILQQGKVTLTGGDVKAPIIKTYENFGVPYATYAQQTGTSTNFNIPAGTLFTAVSATPTKSVAPTTTTATSGTTSSTATSGSSGGTHYVAALNLTVDNKTGKIVRKGK